VAPTAFVSSIARSQLARVVEDDSRMPDAGVGQSRSACPVTVTASSSSPAQAKIILRFAKASKLFRSRLTLGAQMRSRCVSVFRKTNAAWLRDALQSRGDIDAVAHEVAVALLLILDKPTLGLAPLIMEQISKALERLRNATQITVLLGEQNIIFAFPTPTASTCSNAAGSFGREVRADSR
jgi:hypothetical protein